MPIRTTRNGVHGTLLLGVAVVFAVGCQHTRSSPPAEISEKIGVGYGTQPKEEVTGAISSTGFSYEDTQRRVARVEEMMQGRFAGVQVIRSGDGISVRVRGESSLLGGGEPLYVIDGMPVRHTPRRGLVINPMDVVRIEVLKDLSSTAIYGERGANGVILITTRRGH